MGRTKRETGLRIFMVLMAIFAASFCSGFTDPRDVLAINTLHTALGFPPLPGWIPIGGDPCSENWKGVLCVNANITGIVLSGANLGGELGDSLGNFASIMQIDLSNNQISGTIPSNLPVTLRSFFLSGNQLIGSIPDTLSSLGQLSELSLNDNHLSGEIPDAFQQLTSLINLDVSGNDLSGQLPPSMESLSALTALHLQNNQLVGTLNVLQDLPLQDLNIENNLFSGPIPVKLLSIPNFRKDGNPFNTTVIPAPPDSAPSPSPLPSPLPSSSEAPSPESTPGTSTNVPSSPKVSNSSSGGKFLTAKRFTWIAIAGFLIFIVVALGFCLFVSRCCRRRQSSLKVDKLHEMGACFTPKEKLKLAASSINKEDHAIDVTGLDVNILPPTSSSFPALLPSDKVTINAIVPPMTTWKNSSKCLNSARSFTIAMLQQYTNSFSEENLIGGGMLGTVYKAELPSGKLLAVKKLETAASCQQSPEDFLELVSSVSKLQHTNVVGLMGYCAEHGHRLLVYEHCNNGTLHDALHLNNEAHEKLSWITRIRLALEAAKALEYLHEVCQPPIMHRNFKSANILLDDELTVHVSDCGLAPLIFSSSASQLQGYGAPELELGSYTYQSDVYSFGVVMLELLTGRKSYDRSRPRGEQFLVRWAIPQLHDIDALSRMADPSLSGMYPSKSLSRFADIISLCVQPEPEFRPQMSDIVQSLLQMFQRDSLRKR